jgi:hypothetical protein
METVHSLVSVRSTRRRRCCCCLLTLAAASPYILASGYAWRDCAFIDCLAWSPLTTCTCSCTPGPFLRQIPPLPAPTRWRVAAKWYWAGCGLLAGQHACASPSRDDRYVNGTLAACMSACSNKDNDVVCVFVIVSEMKAMIRSQSLPPNSTMQKEDSYHIKISAHTWSTKYR